MSCEVSEFDKSGKKKQKTKHVNVIIIHKFNKEIIHF